MLERPSILLLAEGVVGAAAAALLRDRVRLRCVAPRDPLPNLDDVRAMGIAADRPYPDVAERLDFEAFAHGIGWCGTWVVAHQAEVGPVVAPGRSACRRCFLCRRQAHADEEELDALIDRMGVQTSGPWFAGFAPAFTNLIANLLADELLGLAQGGAGGHCWRLDAVNGTAERHDVAPVAWCDRCTTHDAIPNAANQELRKWARI